MSIPDILASFLTPYEITKVLDSIEARKPPLHYKFVEFLEEKTMHHIADYIKKKYGDGLTKTEIAKALYNVEFDDIEKLFIDGKFVHLKFTKNEYLQLLKPTMTSELYEFSKENYQEVYRIKCSYEHEVLPMMFNFTLFDTYNAVWARYILDILDENMMSILPAMIRILSK
jgi:hypothetical protein